MRPLVTDHGRYAPGSAAEKRLHEAAAVPLKLFDLVCEAIEILRNFVEKRCTPVIFDVAIGDSLCRAARERAAVNIDI